MLSFSQTLPLVACRLSLAISFMLIMLSRFISRAREYLDCVSHARLLSWLLLGSLTHTVAGIGNNLIQSHGLPIPIAQPIPQEASCHIADQVQFILSAFPDHYKSSTVNISSLFHAFNLCQLWTLYLEEYSRNNCLSSEIHNVTTNIILEFWGKVTPCILQLIQHSKVTLEIQEEALEQLMAALINFHLGTAVEDTGQAALYVLKKNRAKRER